MFPLIMAAIQMAQQKAQQQNQDIANFNAMNTQNMLANNQQPAQMPTIKSVYGSY